MQRHLLTVCALGLLFLAVTVSGFLAVFTATNTVENQRSTRLAQAAIASQKAVLASVAYESTVWDDAAKEVYVNGRLKDYFHESWADYTTNNDSYDLVALVDKDQKSIAATEKGYDASFDVRSRYGNTAFDIIKTLSMKRPHAEILVEDKRGLAIIAASVVRHSDSAQNEALVGREPQILLYKRYLTKDAIATLGKNYNVPGLRFQKQPDGKNSQPLVDATGKRMGYLAWDAPTAGFEAAKNSLPVLLISSLLFFIALSFGSRMGSELIGHLSTQANTDSLSSMPNRRALRTAILDEQHKNRAHALALIDLDGFKYVNDNFGHPVGDQLIKQIAEILKEQVGNAAMVARLGGDEFAVLITGDDCHSQIQAAANRFLDRLGLPIMVGDRALAIGASIGLASTYAALKDESELLRRADIAMYEAKHLGKMQIRWYDPHLDDAQSAYSSLAEELRVSLSRNELSIVYQPIINIKDNQFTAVEALARWTSPSRGVVPPETFIQVAENTGLIDAIGLYILRRACTELDQWDEMKLAVNISAAQLRNPMFPHQLKQILDETGFAPVRLELEITETYLVTDAVLARKVITDVMALGVTISLDDFGTGYASIGFLRQFPFAKLKIDQSLVRDAQHDEAARMLVQVSVAAARALNMKVIAEGVETSAQADLMKAAGCDQLQGWHYSRPLVHSDLAELLLMQKHSKHPMPLSNNAIA